MIPMPAPADLPLPLPACNCGKARHEHGTRRMYQAHRCRCVPCAKAESDYYYSQARPKNDWVPAHLARERVLLLRAAGLTLTTIADMTAVHLSQISALENGVGGKPQARVRATTYNALCSIRARDVIAYEPSPDAHVKGDSARRQVEALHCRGWSVPVLVERSGVSSSTFSALLGGAGITESTRLRVDAMFRELALTDPPAVTATDRNRKTLALARAARNRWTADVDLAEERELLFAEIRHLPPAARINSDRGRLQLQSLHCQGWSTTTISERSGVPHRGVLTVLRGEDAKKAHLTALEALFWELDGTAPPSETCGDRQRIGSALRQAAAGGWTTDTDLAVRRDGMALAA